MKSYFVFLSRHKLYTAIQAIGLIISIAFIILIGNYVWHQYKTAYSNPYSERVFVVGYDKAASLSSGDKDILEKNLPGLEAITRVSSEDLLLTVKDENLVYPTLEIDQGFFDIFPEYEILEGRVEDLKSKCLLVSENFANTHFSGKNPIGKKLGPDDLEIKGVFRINGLTLLQETEVLTLIHFNENSNEYDPFSSIGSYLTFIKMPEKTDIDNLEENISRILRPYYDSTWISEFRLYSLPYLYFNDIDWQLKKGDKALLKVVIGVIVLLLLSSMINYINLTLAQSGQRAKEMATRKLHGASKYQIIFKNIFESVFFIFICSLLGICLAYIFKDPVSNLLKQVSMDSFTEEWRISDLEIVWNVGSVFIFIGFILVLGIISGLIPALYSAAYKPIDIVKGTFRLKNRMIFGKVFIVVQIAVAVLLISLSMVMESQLNHMRCMPLNANKKNIYFLNVLFENYDEAVLLKDRIIKIPGVKKIGYGTSYPGKIGMYSSIYKGDKEAIQAGFLRGDRNYFDIMGLNIISGNKNPEGSGILYLSESLANALSITDDISAAPYLDGIEFNGTKVSSFGGIFKDVPNNASDVSEFNYNTVFILADGDKMRYSNVLLVRSEEETDQLEVSIMHAYSEYIKEKYGVYIEPWENGFLSKLNEKNLNHIKSTVVLLEIFMAIAILLSLLGLIAMSTYYANENTKGIAIRKVLGSDIKGEIHRNIRIYMIIVIIAIAMAIPLAIVISREYLSRFAYRIEQYWWIFLVASLGSLMIAFLSVFWQISSAAHINPAKELKKE